jgi:hypothetical protein
MLTSAPILQHYSKELKTYIKTDASDKVVARVLSQKHREHWLPVVFFFKTINLAKCNYQIYNKEIVSGWIDRVLHVRLSVTNRKVIMFWLKSN